MTGLITFLAARLGGPLGLRPVLGTGEGRLDGMARWKRISVEMSHTWPGEAYLRFEAADGTATMVAVDKDDLARVSKIGGALGKPADAEQGG